MPDPRVDRFKLRGDVYLWRSPAKLGKYYDWDCTADGEGCRSVMELIDLMLDAAWSSSKVIPLARPTDAVLSFSGRGKTPWRSPDGLRLVYPKGAVDDRCFRWSGDLQSPTLTVGLEKLNRLRQSFDSISRFHGDFCIHADDQPRHGEGLEGMAIWFW